MIRSGGLFCIATIFLCFGLAYAEEPKTFDGLWKEATSKPNHHTVDEGSAIRVEVPDENAIYFFTKPGQPAHPGVVERSVVSDAEGVNLRTQGWSFGQGPAVTAFEAWLAKFKEQDAQIRARLHAKP